MVWGMTQQQPVQPQQQSAQGNPMAIASFVIGLVTLLLAFARADQFLLIVGGLVALMLGSVGYTRSTATGKGRVLTVLGAVAGVVAVVLGFTLSR